MPEASTAPAASRESFGSRLGRAMADRGPLCVGIDPHPALLQRWGLTDDAAGLERFSLIVLEAVGSLAAAVKPQVALYERQGSAGIAVLERTLAAAAEASVLTIADAKRGDIGSTMAAYADAWLRDGSALAADSVTLSPYLGFESLSYPIRFRNVRVRELPAKETWDVLYDAPADFAKWQVASGTPIFEPRGAVLRGDGNGQLATIQTYRDFVLHLYIRGVQYHNGGVIFRSIPKSPTAQNRSYEIQLHDVEGAHYATGSLYSIKRSIYPRIEPEKWFLLQLIVQGSRCLVRINGENVLEYDGLQNLEAGRIELQAHDAGRWIEYKEIKIRRL